jgi:DUF971 family protein
VLTLRRTRARAAAHGRVANAPRGPYAGAMHEPIQFGPRDGASVPEARARSGDAAVRPVRLDLQRDAALTIAWSDGRVSVYPIAYLRQRSPSAEAKAWQEEQRRNPLAVMPAAMASAAGRPLSAESAELVGKYALRIRFSDGHDTGIYTWPYLREIDPTRAAPEA